MIIYLYHGNGDTVIACATRERAKAELAHEVKFLTEGVCGWRIVNGDVHGDGSAVLLMPFGAEGGMAMKYFYFEAKELLP